MIRFWLAIAGWRTCPAMPENLSCYAGKMKRGSVVQLSAQLVEESDARLAVPEGILPMGDFYQVAFGGKVTYQIHKDGNLVRAYAAGLSWVENTIMGLPAAILALLQGKLLLKGELLHAHDWAYALIGGELGLVASPVVPGKAVMVAERDGQYMGIAHICPGDSEVAIEALSLLGFFVRQYDREQNAISEITSPDLKKNIILENIVGYNLFPEQLKQMASSGKAVNELSRKLYMAAMLVR